MAYLHVRPPTCSRCKTSTIWPSGSARMRRKSRSRPSGHRARRLPAGLLVPVEGPEHEEAQRARAAPVGHLGSLWDQDGLSNARPHSSAVADHLELTRLNEKHLVVLQRPTGELRLFREPA